VHHTRELPERAVDEPTRALHRRIKHEFDPTGRLNPGVDVLVRA
jgi:glycolate oxidase FAD binding subunit